jgi:hypothetical protein
MSIHKRLAAHRRNIKTFNLALRQNQSQAFRVNSLGAFVPLAPLPAIQKHAAQLPPEQRHLFKLRRKVLTSELGEFSVAADSQSPLLSENKWIFGANCVVHLARSRKSNATIISPGSRW